MQQFNRVLRITWCHAPVVHAPVVPTLSLADQLSQPLTRAVCCFSVVREIKVEITTRRVSEWMTPVPRLHVGLLNQQTARSDGVLLCCGEISAVVQYASSVIVLLTTETFVFSSVNGDLYLSIF